MTTPELVLRTTPRARVREDRAGDPLDGLVNMFDLGIVLALAFLLAGLSVVKPGSEASSKNPVVVEQKQSVQQLHLKPNQKLVGHGVQAGTVYRLDNGQLVYVPGPTPSAQPPSR